MHLFAIVILLVIAGSQIDARRPPRVTPRRPIQVPPGRPVVVPSPRNTRPCVCRPLNDPVCGTNGVTYGNDCELKCAQKRIEAIKLDCQGSCPCKCDCNSGKSQSRKCEEECAQTSNVCLQPKVTGPCEAYFPMWFHNNQTKQCEQFVYGGCQGNGNRFESKEQCEKTCVKPPSEDPCKLPKDGGPCKAALRRWYYDTKEADCKHFPYGGCQGNGNRFDSKEQCEKTCVKPPSEDPCKLPKDGGPCPANLRRWYYDTKKADCDFFSYGGCGGNANNFESRKQCQDKCKTVQ